MVGVETPYSYSAFAEYLALGPARSLRALAGILVKPPGYVRQLEHWSSQHNWQARAAEYDQHTIAEALRLQPAIREDAIRLLAQHAASASQVIVDLVYGQIGEDCDMVDILDKRQNVVGERPAVAPSTRLQAAIRLHESLGIVPPKRIEHSGPDGEAIALATAYANAMDQAMLADLRRVAAKHAPTPEEIAAATRKLDDQADELEEPDDQADELEELDDQADE